MRTKCPWCPTRQFIYIVTPGYGLLYGQILEVFYDGSFQFRTYSQTDEKPYTLTLSAEWQYNIIQGDPGLNRHGILKIQSAH